MSRIIIDVPGLTITQYVGPCCEGTDRRRYQLTNIATGEHVSMTRQQLADIAMAIDDYLANWLV